MLGKVDFGLATSAEDATDLISLLQAVDPFEAFEIFEAHDFVVAHLSSDDLYSWWASETSRELLFDVIW